MPFDPNQPFEVVAAQPKPAEFDPSQPFEVVKPNDPPKHLSNLGAALYVAAQKMPGPEGLALRTLLTRGGTAGDVAAEIVPAVAGSVAGSAVAPGPGTVAGGAGGALVGNALKQARELTRGDRQTVGKGELAISGALGALPVSKVKDAATVGRTVAKIATTRALQGGAIAGAAETARQITDEDHINLGQIAETTLLGTGFGLVLGGAEGGMKARALGRAIANEKLPGAIKAAVEPPQQASPRSNSNLEPGPGVPPAEQSKPLGLVESAKKSPEIAPELQQSLEGYYDPITNKDTLARASLEIDKAGSLDAAKAAVMQNQNPDAVSNAVGLELVRRYQTEGRLQDAADVIYNLSIKAKNQGQAIQVLSTLARSTPEGMAAYATKLFGRALTEDELARINAAMQRIEGTKSPEVKLARSAQLLDELHRQADPAKWDEKASAVLNLSMLLNPKTLIRNVGGNVIMATADLGADVITPMVDSGVSIFTGKRTIGGPQMLEYFKGLGQPVQDVKLGYQQARSEGVSRLGSIKEGLETMSTLAKLTAIGKTEVGDINRAYRTVFSNPVARLAEKTLSVALGSTDRAFYTARLKSSLARQLKAAGAAAPTADMIDIASMDAARAVYQDTNFLSNSLRDVRGAMNRLSTLGTSRRFGAGTVITPFVQVPGSLLMRGLEFSPAGFVKSASEALTPVLSKRAFNQKEFSESFARAVAGTTGLVATGYWLNHLGIISGAPETDPKVRDLERALGFGGYRINASALKRALQTMDWTTRQEAQPGDVFYSYDWAQPMSFPIAMGADISASGRRKEMDKARGKTESEPSRVLSAIMSGARTVEEQPMLTGLSAFMSNAANASREGAGMVEALGQSMLQLPGMYLPTATRQINQRLDNRVYETRGSDKLENAYLQVVANIPKMAEMFGLKPRTDPLGDLAERYQANGNSAFNVYINPAFVSRFKRDPELNELYRLWQQTGERAQIPGNVDRRITINGKPKLLTATEVADYQQYVGRLTRDAYRMMMRSDGYQRANDAQRAELLGKFVSAANSAAKIQLFGNRPATVDKYTKALLGISENVDR